MGLSLSDAERCGIGHLHPDHPDNKRDEAAQTSLKPKASKYRNIITTYKGVKYASKAEAVRAEQLDWLVSSGQVREWTRQPTFHLGCAENTYRADFRVIDAFGREHVEDVKGARTAKFNHDVRLWKSYGPCPLHVLSRGKVVEVVNPGGEGS